MKTGDDAGLETDVRVIFALKVHLRTCVSVSGRQSGGFSRPIPMT